MQTTALSYRREGPIAVVRLLDPVGGNPIGRRFLEELADACAAAGGDPGLRALVIGVETGPFSRGWASGELERDAGTLLGCADSFRAVAGLALPTIAAIEGDAIGAGAELALACDLRVAGASARFAFPEVGMGRMPMAGGTQRLVRLVGRARALEFVLWGEPIIAGDAQRCGLVNRVVADGTALAEALALAGRIAERGPLGVRFAREAIVRGAELPLEQGLRLETDLTVLLQSSDDRTEGVRAFMEKREPRFRGQ